MSQEKKGHVYVRFPILKSIKQEMLAYSKMNTRDIEKHMMSVENIAKYFQGVYPID